MPVVFRLLLGLAVVALGVGVLYVGAGGLSRVAGAVGSSFGGFVDELVATPVPTATDIPISDAPLLEPPAEPYTSRGEGRSPGHRSGHARRRRRASDPRLPAAQGPVARCHRGVADRRHATHGRAGRPREGHQRLLGDHRRPVRQLRGIGERPLRPRQLEAEDQDHLAEGQRAGQPQGGRDQGHDPVAGHAHRPQRHQRRLGVRRRRGGRDIHAQPAAGLRDEPHHDHRDRPGGQRRQHRVPGPPRLGQAQGRARGERLPVPAPSPARIRSA